MIVVRHLHIASMLHLRGSSLAGARQRDRAGTSEINAKRRGRTLSGDCGRGIRAGHESDREQADGERTGKTRDH
jgi:hypothetical protein